jgi:hypothetical protein
MPTGGRWDLLPVILEDVSISPVSSVLIQISMVQLIPCTLPDNHIYSDL